MYLQLSSETATFTTHYDFLASWDIFALIYQLRIVFFLLFFVPRHGLFDRELVYLHLPRILDYPNRKVKRFLAIFALGLVQVAVVVGEGLRRRRRGHRVRRVRT